MLDNVNEEKYHNDSGKVSDRRRKEQRELAEDLAWLAENRFTPRPDECTAIWRSALQRALLDATLTTGPCSKGDVVAARRAARNFLNNGSNDFRIVCENCGLEPEAVREAWKSGRITHDAFKAEGSRHG